MLGSRSWRALMWRNLVYRKRNPIGTFLEFILPITFIGLLVVIKKSAEGSDSFSPELVPEYFPTNDDALRIFSFTDYVTALQAERKCRAAGATIWGPPSGSTDEFEITGIALQGYNWQVPFVQCDSRLCEEEGQDATEFCEFNSLGLAPSDEADTVGKEQVEAFQEYIYNRYPQLLDKDALPFDHDFIKVFDSDEAVEDYVTGKNYNDVDVTKIALAVVFDGTDDAYNYAYKIRVNSTGFNSPEGTAAPRVPTTPPTDRLFEHYAKVDSQSCPLFDGAPDIGPYQSSCTGQYIYNGFMTTQRLVHDFIFEATGAKERGYYVAEHGVQYAPFPSKAYEENGFYAAIADIAPLFVTLGVLYPVAAIFRYLVLEKQLRQKELMKMMSVTESDIGWSWFLTFAIFHVVTAIATAAVTTELYSNSSYILLLIFWIFSLLAIITFAMFVAAFFTNATRATLVGLLVFFVGYFLTLIVDFQEDSVSSIGLVSLHPVGAFAYGLQEIGRLEDLGVGLTSDSIGNSDSPSGYTFGNTLQNLIADCIFWGILSWYANRVVPSDFGRPLPWYFPFTLSYWCPGSSGSPPQDELNDSENNQEEGVLAEPVSKALKEQAGHGKSIEIRNLKKVFGEKIAVDGLNMSMYNGQITALLGHNGAGKTTTIGMLTGMLAPTEGYAVLGGKDIRTQMASIRQDLGICLQHDCLFPDLTVKEHIQFFSMVKGLYAKMSWSEVDEKVNTCIKDVALAEKSNTLSKNLSGGMKRKLSVAIAFSGDSKMVLLDEPTSGMDPFSRRFTWNVIRQYRQDRCIILTTHFMDEADILGDRIAIMAEGQLRCIGSSLFLKRAYGVGYHLTIEKYPEGNKLKSTATASLDQPANEVEVVPHREVDDTLKAIVTGAVPDATLLTNVGTEISFQLPIGSSASFPGMLEELDGRVEDKFIVTYGVGITTLDEVFLLVARGDTNEKEEFASSRRDTSKGAAANGKDEERSVRSRIDLESENLFGRHVVALFRKRAANFKRDKKAWTCTTILPSLFVLAGFLLFQFASQDRNMDPLILDLSDFNADLDLEPQNPIPFNNGDEFQCQPGLCIDPIGMIVNESSTGELYSFCGMQAYMGPNASCSQLDNEEILEEITSGGAQLVGDTVTDVLEVSRSIFDSAFEYAASQYGGLYFTHDPQSVIQDTKLCLPDDGAELDPEACMEMDPSDFGVDVGIVGDSVWLCSGNCTSGSTEIPGFELPYNDTVIGLCLGNKGDYLREEECFNYAGFGYLLRYNFTALHAAPTYQKVADEAIVREALGDNDFKIKSVIHPLPMSYIEESIGQGDDAFSAWFLVVLSFPFIAGAFATFVVAERESKAKHLQTVAGVKPSAYWISTWLWDVANYQFPLWITVILMFAFDVEVFVTSENGARGGVIALLVLYGPAAASYSYCMSFLFKSPSICNLFLIISGFLIAFGGSFAAFILRLIGSDPADPKENLVNAAKIVEWILRFIPPFNLGKGLFNVIYFDAFEWLAGKQITVWHETVLLYEVIFLGWQSILYLLLAMQLDTWSSNPRAISIWNQFVDILTCRCGGSRGASAVNIDTPDDDDVLAEQQRVLSGGANDDLIVACQLTKVYDNGKLAVNNLSLGIPPGQCFGLLGINGAGKTTTMGMLTAEFPPTSGDATLAGFSVSLEPEKTRRRVGYCPQFDAHFTNMTGREHIELYASIKGVPVDQVKGAAAAKLAEVGLSEEDSDRLSAGYSGGMKRRLSLACATIGQPQIVFLDECSTGVDPVARREIWQMISDMVINDSIPQEEKTSVVLTTHSMEECEALCPRIAIMANGKIRCLGSAQHLKSKFGQGYQVEMKIKHVETADKDYDDVLKRIVKAANVQLPEGIQVDEEEALDIAPDEVFLTMEQAMTALSALTGDSYLTAMVNDSDPQGYLIYKEASSPAGIDIDALTMFAVGELRMKKLNDFIAQTHPNSVLRERQDTKARYEVSSQGTKMSKIFGSIEENKEALQVAEYGVSQTSLEQVFNMHAAEAEKLKLGTLDS